MTASLLHGDEEVVGTLTSGSSESILLTVKTYRDMARATLPHVREPEILVPITAHPAFVKAGALFGVRIVIVPVGPDKRVSLAAVEAAISPNTILLVASAPQQPHGVVDPIPALAGMAQEQNVPLHVDAGLGGFMLPFLEKLGYEVTPWDFRLDGVSSISVDMHKYGCRCQGPWGEGRWGLGNVFVRPGPFVIPPPSLPLSQTVSKGPRFCFTGTPTCAPINSSPTRSGRGGSSVPPRSRVPVQGETWRRPGRA